jgi:CBS domain-containing protein
VAQPFFFTSFRAPVQTRETTTPPEITNNDYTTVGEETTPFDIMEKMRSRNVLVAVVTDDRETISADRVKGLITKQQIGAAMTEAIDLFLE